jgi:hypothetical protein
MRGARFAENFVSSYRVGLNNGTVQGSGSTLSRGLTVDGNGYLEFDAVPMNGVFSMVIRFSAAVTSTGILFGNQNLILGTPATGWCVWVDADGVKATHATGAAVATNCEVDFDYADGLTHTVTYVVNLTGGDHSLYVDSLDVDTESTALSGPLGASANLLIAGDGTDNFIGSISKIRLFDAELTEAEHDVYTADTVKSFWDEASSVYSCSEQCDQPDTIWDRTVNVNDLYKADGAVQISYPDFNADEYYEFDGVDDYVSGWADLAAAFTITAVTSTSYPGRPAIQQHNDLTFRDQISTPGGYSGFLHSLKIYDSVLASVQLKHDEYSQLKFLPRGPVSGIEHNLITEGSAIWVGKFNVVFYSPYIDWSRTNATGVETDVTEDPTDGLTFPLAGSNVEVSDEAALRVDAITISLTGDFSSFAGTSYIAQKGSNYYLTTSAASIDFKGSTIAHTWAATDTHLAVTAKTGFKPRFFINGEFIGEGNSTVTLDDTDTSDLIIGNNLAKNDPYLSNIKRFLIMNQPLVDDEVRVLYERTIDA